MDLARSYVHTINREIQGCDRQLDQGWPGDARHREEQTCKEVRDQLTRPSRPPTRPRTPFDGIGNIAPHAKNVEAHLLNAAIALYNLGEVVGAEPLTPPGINAFRDVKKDG